MAKVAILGTVPNSRRVAPYNDNSWDIWVCSAGNSQAGTPPRITAWYELHALVDCRCEVNKAWWPNYIAWLNQQQFPVFMQERNPEVPRAMVFPRNTLLKKWGPSKTRTNWFTSSIAWMIAHALHLMQEKPGGIQPGDEIGIFGVDMAATEEHYSWQKAGILRFFEIARELGVKITVPLESTLAFGFPLYGYDLASNMGRAMIIREQEAEQNVNAMQQQMNQMVQNLAFQKGMLEQIKFDRRTYVSGLDDAQVDFDEGFSFVNKIDTPSEKPASEAAPTGFVHVPTALDFPSLDTQGVFEPHPKSDGVTPAEVSAPVVEAVALEEKKAVDKPKRVRRVEG